MGSAAPAAPRADLGPDDDDLLLARIREQLKARGAVGISGLSRNFRIIDTDKSGKLNEDELRKLLDMCKLSIDDEELHRLFALFDETGDGAITFDEFLKQVRGRMGAARRGMVVKVFRTLDELGDGNGYLDVADIKGAFDARASPDVIKGLKTEQQVLREFVSGFEGSKGNRDGMVSLDEWLNYYEELSAGIDSDDAFGAMLASVWSALKTIDAQGREVCVVRHTPASAIDRLEKMLRVKIWQKSTRAKNERKVLEDAFKHFDTDGSLCISCSEFAAALERFGLFASADEVSALFERYDADADGRVSFAEFRSILEADDGQGVKMTGSTLALTEGHDGRRYVAGSRPSTAAPTASAATPLNGGAGARSPVAARRPSGSPLPARRPIFAMSATPSVAGMSSVSAPGRSAFAQSAQPSAGPASPPSSNANVRVRSIANPLRANAREDPDYFKKSSRIFG